MYPQDLERAALKHLEREDVLAAYRSTGHLLDSLNRRADIPVDALKQRLFAFGMRLREGLSKAGYATDRPPTLRGNSHAAVVEHFESTVLELFQCVMHGHGTQDIAAEAKSRIDREFHNPELTIVSIAQALGVRRERVHASFSRAYRMPPRDYLRHRRIRHAVELIATTDLQMKAVAFEAGFKDYSGFYRAFIRIVGTTPSRSRGLQRNDC